MSAFTNGPVTNIFVCVARAQLPRQSARQLPTLRSFRSSAFQRASAPKRAVKTVKSPAPTQAAANVAKAKAPLKNTNPSTYAFVKQLAQKSTPTVLYEAPSHAWMKLGSWMTAIFCFSYAGYNITIYTSPPEGLSWWVGKSYSIIAIAMACMGTYWLLKSKNIIKTIRALPTAQQVAAGATGPRAAVPPLNLEITVKRMLPLMKPRVLVMPYTDATMVARIVAPAEYLTPIERVEKKRAEERERAEKRKYELSHIWSAPFRHLGRGTRSAWAGLKQSLTGSGFATLKANGDEFRLDISNAWMLDEGKALERLVRVVGIDLEKESKWARIYR
ncbi:hypothetical protein jhhlp_002004 [Lomentospora prolificans]|uniref:Uncharacterized protein n=1 Tax=Lomentospora prolificans TaxID=41688 RepID=A0A2N3NCS6_9PEZI|nr:hypothetical protein jhhlp_002004 [Lomentospora prolificans]